MKKLLLIAFLMLQSIHLVNSQTLPKKSKKVSKYLAEEEEVQKKLFPTPLSKSFEKNTLGAVIQEMYEKQAKVCGIKREGERMYIPEEILNGYGEEHLRKTKTYTIPLKATNLLFLTMTTSDIDKINNGSFVEDEYLQAKRIIGLNDNLLNFGQSMLSPIEGFPSLFYQKSCGSYFTGDLTAKIGFPVAELQSSLDAETKKNTSITTITGNFFSPLYLIFRNNDAQSTYAHLLLWEIYLNDYKKNANNNFPLYSHGKYISEFNGTLTNRAINSEESMNMSSKLSANISYGILSANGNVNAGNKNKISFDLKDFITSIHKLNNGNLSWDVADLPKISEINQKLQNYVNHISQPPMNGFLTHLLPTEITRVLVGVPPSLCDKSSWIISSTGYNRNIWQEMPRITSTWIQYDGSKLPECICKVTGFIKKETIDNAVRNNGFIELLLTAENVNEINKNKLSFNILEPAVRVTDNPKITNLSNDLINANRQEIRIPNKIFYNFPVRFTINTVGIQLTEPYKISNIQIEYLNNENQNQLISINESTINNNEINFNLKSSERSQDNILQGEIIIPIKIKFNIEIKGGSSTQLVTNTINLRLPNLIEKTEIKSSLKD